MLFLIFIKSIKLLLDSTNHYRMLALKQYELTNHLGNVLATVQDRKTPVGTTNISRYTADVTNATYYYPFGSAMRMRVSDTSLKYSFGFNENDVIQDSANCGKVTIESATMAASGFTNILISNNYIKTKNEKTTLFVNYLVSAKVKKGKSILKSFKITQFMQEATIFTGTANTYKTG